MYTIRKFPTHLVAMDGSKPFSEYEGGILGVLQKEMEQFTEFSDRWYVKDFQGNANVFSNSSEAAAKSVTSGLSRSKHYRLRIRSPKRYLLNQPHSSINGVAALYPQ